MLDKTLELVDNRSILCLSLIGKTLGLLLFYLKILTPNVVSVFSKDEKILHY